MSPETCLQSFRLSRHVPRFASYPQKSVANSEIIIQAIVNVRFDPFEELSPPPSLTYLQSELQVATGFASTSIDEIPTKSSQFNVSRVRGMYVDSMKLASLRVSNVEWQRHTSSASLPSPQHPVILEPSKDYKGGSFYTAKVDVPICIPKGKRVLVPSFHSCLISRIYAVDLSLTVNTPSAMILNPTLQLKLPIQVSSEGNATPIISAEVWINLPV